MFPGNGEFVQHFYGEDSSSDTKDWKAESTLFCGITKHTEWALTSDSKIQGWYRVNPGKGQFPCPQHAFTRSGVAMCAYDKTPQYKIDIDNLSSAIQKCETDFMYKKRCSSSQNSADALHGTINTEHYQIITIQNSATTQRFRVRGLNIKESDNRGSFITFTNPVQSDTRYDFEFNLDSRYGAMDVSTSVDFRLSRDSLMLTMDQYLLGERREPINKKLSYSCRVIDDVEIDKLLVSLPAIRAKWKEYRSQKNKERKEKNKELKEAQLKNNKI